MSDKPSILPPPSWKSTSPMSSLFGSPKLFVGFSSKGFSDSEAAISPTSILETKPLSIAGNPFFAERNHRKPYCCNEDSRGIGLGLIDALTKEKPEKRPMNPSSRMVLFGSHLKIQIPEVRSSSPSPIGSVESPLTLIEFGIKNKNSQLALLSPAGLSCQVHPSSPRHFRGCLSPREMELSEDYTCVISYGPNPKMTHIFDNCIVESCGDGFVPSRKDSRFSAEHNSGHPSKDFLSFCHACKKSLAQGKDIFMYRGEQAFCSQECRHQEILSDKDGNEDCFQDLLDHF
ncbi:hypothetical protein HPP92_023999 [Vanilla planifolia]|uniref:FLZ-type domain-containing protein n=1 Tax=Vanilla planifolia TaxID=51239 RepID=A0A835PPX5_VANPL|nr:hypothetical protein HPP92_023999 [Vanilla planifolia]